MSRHSPGFTKPPRIISYELAVHVREANDYLTRMNTHKRNASRSPDGSSNQRKFSRGVSIDAGHQRKSSANTNHINANADPRLRGPRSNAVVQSPISTDGSTYQDAASNRATPQPQQPPKTAVMTVAGDLNDDGDAFKTQLLESLMALNAHVTADASLRSSHDLAKHRLERATVEHQNMGGSFSKFPAIKERTSNDKIKAAEKVAKLENQLNTSEELQRKLATPLCNAIWGLFSKAQASARPERQPDAVSKEDYEKLQDRFQKQQDLLDQHQDRLEEQSSSIEELKKIVKEARETSIQAKDQVNKIGQVVPADITTLKNRVDNVELSAKNDKRTLRDIDDVVTRQKKDIEQLRSDSVQNKSDLAAKDVSLTTLTGAVSSATSVTSGVKDQLGKVERSLNTMRTRLDASEKAIRNDIDEPGKESVVGRLKNYDQTINNLSTKVTAGEKAFETRIKSTEEDLRRLLQDLNKANEAQVPARIKGAEDQIEGVAQELRNVKEDVEAQAASRSVAVPTTPAANTVQIVTPPNFDPVAFKNEVVEDTGVQTEALSKQMDEQSSEIEELQGGFASLTERLDRLELEQDNEARKRQSLEQATNDRHDKTDAKYDTIQLAVTTFGTKADALRTDIDALTATVKFLQDQPAQVPPPVNGTVAQQFRPLSVQSPHAPAPRMSVSGPVQTNGSHPPNGTVAHHQSTNGTPAGPANSEPTVTLDQVQGIWAAIQNLRQRYDNLTTEEVVRSMVDQFSKIYPAPKDFQAAVSAMKNDNRIVDAKLTSLVVRLSSLETNVGSYKQNMAHTRHELSNNATEYNTNVNGRIQQLHTSVAANQSATEKLQKDVAANRDATDKLRTDINDTINNATRTFDHAVGLQTDAITKIREQVDAFADVAFGEEGA